MTRNGMGPDEMDTIAELIFRVCEGRDDVRPEVRELRSHFADVKYGFAPEDLLP
jgi:glycine/serine hydroxymethyltransferase